MSVTRLPDYTPPPPYTLDPAGRPFPPSAPPPRRWRVFVGVFTLVALVGLGLNYLRPAVYRSAATLLVEAPAGQSRPLAGLTADGLSISSPSTSPAQLLATEQQRLLGAPVLQQVADEFATEIAQRERAADSRAALQAMAQVRFDAATSLLDVALEGRDPELLRQLLERWLAVFQAARAATTTRERTSDDEVLRSQLAALDVKIAAQRALVDGFREQHGIVSADRTENRDAAKLKGLNESINKAEDEEMRAAARLGAVQSAIAAGQPVTQGKERAAIDRLQERVAMLRDLVRSQGDQFTEKFAQIAPEITAARKDLATAEQDLAAMEKRATAEVLSQAETDLASVREANTALVRQQTAMQGELTTFSRRFDELTALNARLAELEAQAAPLRERVVQAEVAAGDLVPRVTVLAEPGSPGRPIRPHYTRDAGLAVGLALVLALLATWLFEFLTRAPLGLAPPLQPNIYSMNTQLYPPPGTPALPPAYAPAGTALPPPQLSGALPAPRLRELAPEEVGALLRAGDDPAHLLVALVMSGVAADELPALRREDVAADGRLRVGQPPRLLTLPPGVQAMLRRRAELDNQLFSTPDGMPFSAADLAGTLLYLAHDAGLARPEEITLESLRHTCFAYLVRQGLKLGELPRIGGAIAPAVLASYANYSPPGAGLALEQIPACYPALAAMS